MPHTTNKHRRGRLLLLLPFLTMILIALGFWETHVRPDNPKLVSAQSSEEPAVVPKEPSDREQTEPLMAPGILEEKANTKKAKPEIPKSETPKVITTSGALEKARTEAQKKIAKGVVMGKKLHTWEAKKANAHLLWWERIVSFFGIFVLIGLAWLLSNNRKKILWKLVGVGVLLQVGLACLILLTPPGRALFDFLNKAVMVLLGFTKVGSSFLFRSMVDGQVHPAVVNFAFDVLPTIIFFSSLMTVLYYLGIMQLLVKGVAIVMQKFMGTSGAESLSAAANIFVGQTEAPLVIKPYVEKMTKSENTYKICQN